MIQIIDICYKLYIYLKYNYFFVIIYEILVAYRKVFVVLLKRSIIRGEGFDGANEGVFCG